MKYVIETKDPYPPIILDGDKLITDDDLDDLNETQFLENLRELLEETSDIEWLWEELDDNILDFNIQPRSSFEIDSLSRMLYQQAEENILARKQNTIIVVKQYDENGSFVRSREISYCPILHELLDQKHGDCCWDCVLSGYISDCLMKFAEQGSWHFGLQTSDGDIEEDISKWPAPSEHSSHCRWFSGNEELQPIIWFGLNGTAPDPKWIFWDKKHEISNIWSSSMDWEIIEELVENVDKGTLILYTAELACETPTIGEILEGCPVKLECENSDDIQNKVVCYFLSAWQDSQNIA